MLYFVMISAVLLALSACQHTKEPPIARQTFSLGGQPNIQRIEIGEETRFILCSDALFYTNSNRLTSRGVSMLHTVLDQWHQNYPKQKLTIRAFTDNVQTPKFRHDLSLRQAQTVLAYFFAHGIDHQLMNAAGMGPHPTIASNRTVMGSAMNRRVEIYLRKTP